MDNCERCGHLMPEGCIGWCYECDKEEKANYECPNCIPCAYGAFPGGDPREFFPDGEMCSEEELALHKAACAAWDRGERPTVPVSGLEDGAFVERVMYGIGVYSIRCELHRKGEP